MKLESNGYIHGQRRILYFSLSYGLPFMVFLQTQIKQVNFFRIATVDLNSPGPHNKMVGTGSPNSSVILYCIVWHLREIQNDGLETKGLRLHTKIGPICPYNLDKRNSHIFQMCLRVASLKSMLGASVYRQRALAESWYIETPLQVVCGAKKIRHC